MRFNLVDAVAHGVTVDGRVGIYRLNTEIEPDKNQRKPARFYIFTNPEGEDHDHIYLDAFGTLCADPSEPWAVGDGRQAEVNYPDPKEFTLDYLANMAEDAEYTLLKYGEWHGILPEARAEFNLIDAAIYGIVTPGSNDVAELRTTTLATNHIGDRPYPYLFRRTGVKHIHENFINSRGSLVIAS